MKFFQSRAKFSVRTFSILRKQKTVELPVIRYPEAKREEISDNFFETNVKDPFRWLENVACSETRKFIDAQNEVSREFLESCPYREAIRSSIRKSWNYEKYSTPIKKGNIYFQFRNKGGLNQSILYTMNELEDPNPKLLLDPNKLTKDGVKVTSICISSNGKTCAFGLKTKGSNYSKIIFKDTESGQIYREVLKKVQNASISWMPNNEGIFYSSCIEHGEKQQRKNRLFYHQLGTEQARDTMIAQFEDPTLLLSPKVTDCKNYLVVSSKQTNRSNLIHVANLPEDITGPLTMKPIITKFIGDFKYITNNNNKFLFHTNYNAPNNRIIEIDINKPKEPMWQVLIKEHPKHVLQWAKAINDHLLVVCYLQDVKYALHVYDIYTGLEVQDFKIESMGTVSNVTGERNQKEMFYSLSSFLKPKMIHAVNFCDVPATDRMVKDTNFNIESSNFFVKQVFFKSRDEASIPMFLVHKRNYIKNGSKPCLLFGYGGFKVNLTARFSLLKLLFANHFNGIFAVVNARGGGEYGDRWHHAGRLDKKQNALDDLQYAAKYLIEEHYTSPNKLVVYGKGHGGFLVGAAVNQAPELFKAAICDNGIFDMLRYHQFGIGKKWSCEYGLPASEKDFYNLFKLSPLHNIRQTEDYPAVFLTASECCDKVLPCHSLKYLAELQGTLGMECSSPFIMRFDKKSDVSWKDANLVIEQMTDKLCFISNVLNLPLCND